MPKILSVGALDGDIIDIHLSNGSSILLNIKTVLGNKSFESLSEDDRIFYPHTDGSCVYWNEGHKLYFDEIITLLRKE